jgi:hypothetical protein
MKEIIIILLVFSSKGETIPTDNTFRHKEVCEAYAKYRNAKEIYGKGSHRDRFVFRCVELKLPNNHKEGNEK